MGCKWASTVLSVQTPTKATFTISGMTTISTGFFYFKIVQKYWELTSEGNKILDNSVTVIITSTTP